MRGRLYHVGVPESPDGEKVLHGANFTTSNNFDKLGLEGCSQAKF